MLRSRLGDMSLADFVSRHLGHDPLARASSAAPTTALFRWEIGRIREETTPAMTCSLCPGDWLYLRRGWWHVARARSDSLSISLGVLPNQERR